MFGIPSLGVALAFLLCILSSLLCVVYAWLNWNKGDESIQPDDVRWANDEKKSEDAL